VTILLYSILAKAKPKLHCYLGHQERRECQSGFNGLTSIVLRILLFPVPECCNIALRVNRQNYIQATLHCRIGNKCNFFSGYPSGLEISLFLAWPPSDPTCSVLRLSIVNSLRSVHWRKLISTLRMVNPFRMIPPVGMTSVIYRLLVLQVHL